MSIHLTQARLLRERRRFTEARAAIHQHLASAPDDFSGHFELAVTGWMEGKDHRTALAAIERAIGLDPEIPGAHCVRSSILNALDRHGEALAAADEARRLDPENAFAWECRGHALLDLRRLPEAEEAARQALALDPLDETASNLLSTVLRLQQRFDEAEIEIERHLARDPENAWTFATAGWTALNQGRRQQAEELFREALRLDPEMEHARIGLREAYKARSAFYRLYLRWVFFMQRHSAQNRWLIVIGLYLAFKFGRVLLAEIHPLAVVPLVIAYLLFVFGSWLANGLGHFLLLKDRLARLSLTTSEKLDGAVVGGLFFSGAVLLAAGFTVLPVPFALLGGTLMAAAIPAGMVFDNESPMGRLVFGGLALLALGCGTFAAVWDLTKSPAVAADSPSGTLLTVGALAVFASTWLGGVHSLTNAPPK
jgi:Tfp pilus assembly protein PilF